MGESDADNSNAEFLASYRPGIAYQLCDLKRNDMPVGVEGRGERS